MLLDHPLQRDQAAVEEMAGTREYDDRKRLRPGPVEHVLQRHDIVLLAVDDQRVFRHVADRKTPDRGGRQYQVSWGKLLRRGGVVNFFGGCPDGTLLSLDTNLLHYSELTCKASFHHTPALIRKALELVSRGYVGAKDFVNHSEPLTNLLQVMQHLMSHNGHLKTAIIP